jgi:hypothetical protein
MKPTEKVQLNLLLPVNQRDRLRKRAAEQNLQNLKRVTSAAAIGAKIICDYLDKMETETWTKQNPS